MIIYSRFAGYLSLLFLFASCAGKNGQHPNTNTDSSVTTNQGNLNATTGTFKKMVDAPGYMKWVAAPENRLRVKKQIGFVEFEAFYNPALYQVLFTHERPLWDNVTFIRQQVKNLKEAQFFVFSIRSDAVAGTELLKLNLRSDEEYKERLKYCAFYIQHDLFLTDGMDTLPCAFAHFERTYSNGSGLRFSVAFPPGKQPEADKIFIYHDRLFSSGQVNLKISHEALSRIPQVTPYHL